MEELKFIEQAIDRANQRGLFNLRDSQQLAYAIDALTEKLQVLEKQEKSKK